MIKKYASLFLSLYYGLRIFFLLLFSGSALISFTGWDVPIYILLLFCLLFSLIATISDDRYFTNIPYKIRRFLYPAVLLIIVCVLLLRRYDGQNLISYLKTVVNWFIQNLNQNAEYSMEYSLFIVFLLYLILSLLIEFCEKYLKVQLCFSLAIIVCSLLIGSYQTDIFPLALFGGIFYAIDTCTNCCLRKITHSKDVSAYCASLSSVFGVMVMLALILPHSEDPIPYYKMANAFDRAYYEISGLSQELAINFKNAFTGLSDGKIDLTQGTVKKNDSIIIKVYKNARNYNPIYLTLHIADHYTGSTWENTIKTTGEDSEFERNADERIHNLINAGFAKQSPIFHSMSMKIQYRYIYSRNILYPDNCTSITNFKPNNSIEDKDINIRFDHKPKLDTSYSVSVTEINLKDAEVLEYLKSNISFMEASEHDGTLFDTFAPYLQLPLLPERIQNLAKEITENCTSDYEKANLIRQYVQQFPYSTSLSDIPKDTDVADYFLFEQKKGYCIHYATAVAILCRSIGIPSRYVQGIALGAGEKAKQWFDVYSSESHAWCEVYINGYGWMRMDATPIDSINSYHDWPEVVETLPSDAPDYIPPLIQMDAPDKNDEIDLEALKRKQEQEKLLTLYVILAISIFAVIIIILIIITLLVREHKRKLFLQSSFNEQASHCLQEILAHLTYLGITKSSPETMWEFTERINRQMPDQYPEIIKVLTNYNNLRYSEKGFADKDIEALQHGIMLLKSRCIDKYGKFRYMIKTNLKSI